MYIRKTGTTIVGIKYKTGVILLADTRSTSGPVVADKNCNKIHRISSKIMCCGAGTAADTFNVTRMAEKELAIFSYKHMRDPYVSHCERLICDYLYGYSGQIGAALVLGGIDSNGIFLYSIHPNGYSTQLNFTALGSGSLAAIAVVESGYRKDMEREDAIKLGVEAVKAGILNDLYSGSNVDLCIIDLDGVQHKRSYVVVEKRKNENEIKYPVGCVEVLREDIFRYVEEAKD